MPNLSSVSVGTSATAATRRSYLLVDDNAAFAENVAEILEDAGADVQQATDAREALELARAHAFDAIVTDMRMPGMSGAEFVHELRVFDALVPVVLLSAYSQDHQLRAARREGLLAVLSKPDGVSRLVDLLGRARRGGVVALVEDDQALADNLSEVLMGAGLTVVTANALQELDALTVKPFVTLVDLFVPGGTPADVVATVQQRFPDTHAIVITAHPDAAVAGTECYAKPFNSAELLRRLEAILASRAGARVEPDA